VPSALKNTLKVIVFFFLFIGTSLIISIAVNAPMKELPSINFALIPFSLGGWEGENVPMDGGEEVLARESPLIKRKYTKEGHTVWLIGVSSTRTRHSVHHPKYCYKSTGWDIVQSRKGLGKYHLATEVILQKNEAGETYTHLERYWFTDGKHVEPSYFFQLWTAFRVRFFERQLPNWTLFRVATIDYTSDPAQEEAVQDFSDALMTAVRTQPQLQSL